ncbi:MAG TPA: alpha/beta hydrolase [Thermomicrobiaceae bacterium]|nr:alpha/beta hydrolase [Thermomicrobiaceae bacterium]
MDQATRREGYFAAPDGLDLYYQSWTSGAAPARGAVIIVHGIGEHSGAYDSVVARLVPAGYALYGFDLRGHGRSPGRRGFIRSWDDYRQDLAALARLVEAERPGARRFLLGHSMGGVIALDYALRYPDGLAGVAAIAPAIGELGVSPGRLLLARVLSRLWPTFSLPTGLDSTTLSRDPRVVDAYRADPLVHNRGTARLGTEFGETIAWVQAHAADLRVPLLIQHGSADRLAVPDGSRRFVAQAGTADRELREYPDAYHQLHNDLDRDAVLDDLLDWLARHAADRDAAAPADDAIAPA